MQVYSDMTGVITHLFLRVGNTQIGNTSSEAFGYASVHSSRSLAHRESVCTTRLSYYTQAVHTNNRENGANSREIRGKYSSIKLNFSQKSAM